MDVCTLSDASMKTHNGVVAEVTIQYFGSELND